MAAGGASQATGGGKGLLALFSGGREACSLFSGSKPTTDFFVICHEARGMDLSPGEQVFLTLRDMRTPDPDRLAPPGTPWELKSVQADTVLQLRAWAAPDETTAKTDVASRRALGELRIPLARLAQLGLPMLYQTWVTLDIAPLDSGHANDASSFDQKLIDGPRQLFQPKACISICNMEHLNRAGRLVLSADEHHDSREARWGALLKSQQQHVVMSASLHLHSMQANEAGQSSRPDKSFQPSSSNQIQDTNARIQEQAKILQELKAELSGRGRYAAFAGTNGAGGYPSGSPTSAQRTQGGVEAEAAQLRDSNKVLQDDIDGIRADMDKVSDEANHKIDAANERIRGLRRERDDALKEGDDARAQGEKLTRNLEEGRKERQLLADQKEALLRIVEDLHQTCLGAGMDSAGRHSMKDIGDLAASLRT